MNRFDGFDDMEEGRFVTPELQTTETLMDKTLRPQHLNDYIGQEKQKEKLSIFIEAAKMRYF